LRLHAGVTVACGRATPRFRRKRARPEKMPTDEQHNQQEAYMYRSACVALVLVLAALLPGCESMKSMTKSAPDLTGLLTKQLGVSESQATGGVGSMLQLAQESLASGQFDLIAKAIPGTQKYLDAAKQLLGGGKVGNMSGVQSAFSKLGMSPDMVDKFKPVVTNYAGQAGGPEVKSLLEGVLK
jgi:hypothetical protein